MCIFTKTSIIKSRRRNDWERVRLLNREYYGYNRQEIEYEINKYTLKCLRVTFWGVCSVEMLNLLDIFIVSKKLMLVVFFSVAAVYFVTAIFCRCVDMHKPWVKYVILCNIVCAITVISIMVTYHTVLLSVFPILLAAQYSDKKVVVYTYILTAASIFVIVMAGYYWGLCDANMVTLTTLPMRDYMDASGKVRLVPANDNPWVNLPLFYVLPRYIQMIMLYPVIRSITSHIAGYTQYAISMKQLSEIDEMTGLYNKNKYLQMVEEEYSRVETVAIIFWDVNNLKVINDTLGHEEGDYVITNAAATIKELSGEQRKAYRIGGDEFVMVVENPKEDEIDSLMEKWKDSIEKRNSFSKIKISVASGYAFGAGNDIKEVAKKADEQMYLDKHERK